MDMMVSFSESMGDTEVDVQFRASLRDVVSLLTLIHLSQDVGLEESFDLMSIYDEIMNQIVQYGDVMNGDSSD